MKYLIIGSRGFIGQHLFNHLKTKNKVWGADVVVDYEHKDDYFLIDSTNADFKDIFKKQDFDVCINCSGAASVPDSIDSPLRDYFLNTVNVFKILEAIRDSQTDCKFLNLSSAAVYGNPSKLPIKENSQLQPLSPYGIHKRQSEEICQEFHNHFDVKTCSLRIFSAYGDGLTKQLFWDLFKKAQTGKEISLYGTGLESRDFIYITDLVRAIEIVAVNAVFDGKAINIANGKELLIKDVVGVFYNFFNDEVKFQFSSESRAGDPNNWRADISLIKELGYTQEYSINEGLSHYYQWLIQRESK